MTNQMIKHDYFSNLIYSNYWIKLEILGMITYEFWSIVWSPNANRFFCSIKVILPLDFSTTGSLNSNTQILN